MEKQLIRIDEYCALHQVEISFIQVLEDSGLVELVVIDRQKYIPHEQLDRVERLVSWHYELEVNPQGLEVASHLLEQVRTLKEELNQLRSRLKQLED